MNTSAERVRRHRERKRLEALAKVDVVDQFLNALIEDASDDAQSIRQTVRAGDLLNRASTQTNDEALYTVAARLFGVRAGSGAATDDDDASPAVKRERGLLATILARVRDGSATNPDKLAGLLIARRLLDQPSGINRRAVDIAIARSLTGGGLPPPPEMIGGEDDDGYDVDDDDLEDAAP